MHILIASYRFYPNVGGMEAVIRLLASKFASEDHKVSVITDQADAHGDGSYTVLPQPTTFQAIRLVTAADIVYLNGLALRYLWLPLVLRKPYIVLHHIGFGDSWSGRLKKWLAPRGTGIAVSKALARRVDPSAFVVGNPYDDEVFVKRNANRDRDLVFVGRLIREKGCADLLHALGRLRERGQAPQLAIVGVGPAEKSLRELVSQLGIDDQVLFEGPLRAEELAQAYNRHRIAVVPSRCQEGFGVVALEAIACGCVVVGSNGGGLPDAIGPCGLTYDNGDIEQLTSLLERMLSEPELVADLRSQASSHLAEHAPRTIAARHLEICASLVRGSRRDGSGAQTR